MYSPLNSGVKGIATHSQILYKFCKSETLPLCLLGKHFDHWAILLAWNWYLLIYVGQKNSSFACPSLKFRWTSAHWTEFYVVCPLYLFFSQISPSDLNLLEAMCLNKILTITVLIQGLVDLELHTEVKTDKFILQHTPLSGHCIIYIHFMPSYHPILPLIAKLNCWLMVNSELLSVHHSHAGPSNITGFSPSTAMSS